MNYVFMFKNQIDFRKDRFIDMKMLKISIKQWFNMFKDNNKKMYICGSYNKFEEKELIDYITKDYMNKYNIKILNVGSFPKEFNKNKTSKINYQMLAAFNHLKEPMILCANDIFPIKLIDESHLNKEYMIRNNDYTKLPNIDKPEKLHWWELEHINTLKYFNNKFGTNFKTMYEGHSLYYITEEFINFLKANPYLMINSPRNLVLINWLKMKGEDIYKPGFCSMTFYSNNWMLDKKRLQQTKVVNITLPNHPKSKAFLNKVKKI